MIYHNDKTLGQTWRAIPDLPKYDISETGICITRSTGYVHAVSRTRSGNPVYQFGMTTRSILRLMQQVFPDKPSWTPDNAFLELARLSAIAYGPGRTLAKKQQGNVPEMGTQIRYATPQHVKKYATSYNPFPL